jgi:hypothetical protein
MSPPRLQQWTLPVLDWFMREKLRSNTFSTDDFRNTLVFHLLFVALTCLSIGLHAYHSIEINQGGKFSQLSRREVTKSTSQLRMLFCLSATNDARTAEWIFITLMLKLNCPCLMYEGVWWSADSDPRFLKSSH